MSMHVFLIDNHDKLLALRPEWDALADDNPFLSWDWVETWWRHYQSPDTQLFILAVRDKANQLVGLAPWHLKTSLSRGRTVRFIGSNEVCGDRLTILAQHERRANVLQAIAAWLATDARDAWELIELTGVEQSNHSLNEFATMLEARGHQIHIREDLNCWNIELPGNWEEYLRGLSKSRRNKTRRFLRATVDAEVARQCEVRSRDDFERGFNVLVDLHQKRRNQLGEPGAFASERYLAFHQDFAARMLEKGRLRLVWLEFADQPAAVEYSILGDRKIYNYQSGFEPALADEHPGWINLVTTLRWAIANGYREFDMLRGDEAYKASFGGQPSRLMQLRIVGHQNSAKLRHAAWRTQATVKRWAREGIKLANEWRRPTASNVVEVEN